MTKKAPKAEEGFDTVTVFEPDADAKYLKEEAEKIAAIDLALRELASSNPTSLARDLRIAHLAKDKKVGLKVLKDQYGLVLQQIEDSKPPEPVVVPVLVEPDASEEAKAKEAEKLQEIIANRAAQIAASSDIVMEFRDALLLCTGYICDYKTAGTILVSQVCRLLKKSSGFVINGSSASGKTELIVRAARFLPEKEVMYITDSSDKALNYLGDISGKYIVGGELVLPKPGEEDTPWQQAFRQLISDNVIRRSVVEKNASGELRAVVKTTNGPISFMMTTTADTTACNDEFINRVSICYTDDSEEMTERVLHEQALSAKEPDFEKTRRGEIELAAWRQYHSEMQTMIVEIPFSEEIIPRSRIITTRRLNPMIQNYVRALALVHQKSRKINEHVNGYRALVASVDDYRIAYEMILANAPKVSDTVGKTGRAFYEKLKKAFPAAGVKFTKADVQNKLKTSPQTVNRYILCLTKAGCISKPEEKSGRAFIFQIDNDPPTSEDFGLIPPDDLPPANCSTTQTHGEQFDCNPGLGLRPTAQLIPGEIEAKKKNSTREY